MIFDEDSLKPVRRSGAPPHEIGQPLEELSIDELTLRIEILRAEIARLDAMRQGKEATRAGAEALFKL